MRRKSFLGSVVVALSLSLVGCSTLKHNVGEGAPEGAPKVGGGKNFYFLFGLVPLNKVDGGKIAKEKGLTGDYTIKSSHGIVDLFISMFTSIVTVNCQSVAVMGEAGSGGTSASPAAAPAAGTAPQATQYLNAANQLMGQKDYATAARYYQAAAQVDPNSSAAYQGLGTCHYYQGQNAEAKAAFRKALELNPSNTQLAEFLKSIP
jgi:hypothetical protein